jgi:hypothetical protein
VKYFAQYGENGKLEFIGTINTEGEVLGEISAEEYAKLKASILEPTSAEQVTA